MFRFAFALSLASLVTACAVDTSTIDEDLDNSTDTGGGEPHDAKVVHVRGNAGHGGASSPDLIYHGGPVNTGTTAIQAIFWGPSWATSPGDKISGMDSFYGGISNTAYLGTNTEYTNSSGTHVSRTVSYGGHVVDTSTAPKSGGRTSVILAEVCKMISNPVAGGYYPVYTDSPRGHSGYCAWHSSGTCNGVTVQFGFFYKLDGDGGCDPGDPGNTHSQGLEAIANVSGHELSETVTDPQLNAWYDSSGAENADKCAWTFNGYSNFGGGNWQIQGNYSNAAAANHSGYDGAGCINGN